MLAGLPRDSDWLLILQCVLEGALAVERPRADRDAGRPLLAPYAGRSVVNAGAVMWHGVTDDTLARGYALLGDADAAARHRAAALATYERIGATWWRDRLAAARLAGAAAGRTRLVSCTCTSSRAGCGWSAARARRSCCRGCAASRTCTRCSVEPDTDLPATTLVGGEVVEQSGLEVLDDESRRAYRARLAELDAELDALGPTRPASDAWPCVDQLGAATGLGGRRPHQRVQRRAGRVAVRKAIVAALARIAEADPWLGRHLRDRVHTGLECRYESDPDHPVRWLLQAGV